MPVLLDRVVPVHAVVPVDFYMPGCPPPADRIRAVLEQLLDGKAAAPGRARDQVRLTAIDPEAKGHAMTKRIVIDPVTRIEGHAKITIHLDDAGQVTDARFHVAEFRGFEQFCEGRPLWEMAGHHGADLRHLPGQPPARLGQGRRPDHGRDDPAGRREAAPADEPGADRAVARPELLPPQRAGPAAGLGERPGQAQRLRPGRRRARAGPRRHPAAAVRPGDHRAAGRQEDPPGLVGPRRRAVVPDRGGPRPHPRPRPRGAGRSSWTPSAGSRGCSTASRRRSGPSATSRRCSWRWWGPTATWEHYDGKLRFVDGEGKIVADGLDPLAVSTSTSARRSSRTRT